MFKATVAIVFGLLLVVGCKEPDKSANKDRGYSNWHRVTCSKCGAKFVSSSNDGAIEDRTVDGCMECPLDMCFETSMMIISIGSLTEVVSHQPGNEGAASRLAELEKQLADHLSGCKKCKDTLEGFGK